MNTSSSDRCTRISPSAVLDDRLDGKDLEWARDHLRRCESCRERVEEFREMLMRVGRLPSAPIGAVAMDEAFATALPEAARAGAGAMSARGFDMASPEVTNVRDLLSDLEREIFRDEPAQDHPTAMPPGLGSTIPEIEAAAAAVEPEAAAAVEPEAAAAVEPEAAAAIDPEAAIPMEPVVPNELKLPPESTPPPSPPRDLGDDLREIPVDSRWTPTPVPQADLFDVARINALPPPPTHQPDAATLPLVEAVPTSDDDAGVEHLAWAGSPELDPTATEAAPPSTARRNDTVMRVAVGLGAAACVLLAAFLYEGSFLGGSRKTAATVPRATATARVQSTASVAPSPSASPTAPPAPVLFRLGNGVTGGTLYRIRPGTAVAGYTRLVFDIRGRGLPAMVITRPDAMHIAITFANTAGAAVPVKGIRSFQVAGVEPAVQQGQDLIITVDLARPDRVTAFTLPAAGAYSPRLVVDLHTS